MQWKLSGVLADVGGAFGGSTVFHGRTGLTMRNKKRGKNPSTSAQIGVRAQFSTASSAYRSLSDPQLMAWAAAVKNVARKNKVGAAFTGSPSAYYSAINDTANWFNVQAVAAGLSGPFTLPIVDPPAPVKPTQHGNIDNLVIKNITGTQTFTIDIPQVETGDCFVLEATAQMSNGRSFFKGKFRPIKYYAAGAAITADDVLAEYQAVFGNLVVGMKLAVKARYTNIVGISARKYYTGIELQGQVKAI